MPLKVCAAIASIGIPVLLTWWLAPAQEVRSQEAVEQEERQAEQSRPLLDVVEAKYNFGAATLSSLFPRAISSELSTALLAAGSAGPAAPEVEEVEKREGAVHVSLSGSPDRGNVEYTRFRITLSGNRIDPVLITNMSARITTRQAPLSGGIIFTPPQGSTEGIQLGFDLDSSDLGARHVDEMGMPIEEPYLSDHQVTVGLNEKVSFDIVGITSTCYCEWVVDFQTATGEIFSVGNHDQPWRISTLGKSYASAYTANFDTRMYEACRWPDGCGWE